MKLKHFLFTDSYDYKKIKRLQTKRQMIIVESSVVRVIHLSMHFFCFTSGSSLIVGNAPASITYSQSVSPTP